MKISFSVIFTFSHSFLSSHWDAKNNIFISQAWKMQNKKGEIDRENKNIWTPLRR